MQEQNNSEKSNPNNTQIESDGVSMPIPDANENAWPPPNIRQEVVQSAQEDASQQSHQPQQTGNTSTTKPTDASEIVADGDSRAIANENENSWPPPNVRDEIVDSAKQEETTHKQDQA